MRIGIDARSLCGQTTGVGRYLAGLLAEWAVADEAAAHQFLLYAPEAIRPPLDSPRFSTRLVGGAPGTWWEQVRAPKTARLDRLDVWFAPQYTAPLLTATPTVVAVHDVSFAAHPEWLRLREGTRLRWISRRAARGARAVVTISEFSKREIAEWFGIEDHRLHVIPPGVPRHRRARANGGAPRVLFVGSIFNRRHVTDLVRAFAPIARARPDASLDVAGDNRSHPFEDVEAAIEREGLPGQMRWHRYASDEQLAELYGQARAFAFLSEYEGLGLTPLEALAAGVPPVLVDTPVARESCGEAALYVRLGSLTPITQALERVLFDEPTRARLLSAAPAVLARYDWPRAARETLRVLEAAGHE
jgi:glycosyltransferase involved in cell wall biosynthesis